MKNRVVIYPTDFSSCAKNAMTYAIQIAKALKCPIKVVHDIDVSGANSSTMMTSNTLNMYSMMEEEATAALKLVKEEINVYGVECETQILPGNGISYYVQHVEETESVFVVMGTVGAGSIENRIMGSLTSKMLADIKSPTMVVPKEANFEGIGDIIFATDYKTSDTEHFKMLQEIASYFKSNINAVHVCDHNAEVSEELKLLSDFEKEIRNTADYLQMNFQLLYANNIEDRLQSLITEQNADLLVLVTQKRSFFDRFFDKSLAKKMIYHTHIPMLIFANPKS